MQGIDDIELEEDTVNQGSVDLEKLRGALRHLSRGDLLMIADRAIDLVPDETLHVLVGDFVHVPRLEVGQPCNASLLDQMQMFCEASLRGDYFESFDVNGKNCTEQSKRTDAFIGGFDRLTGQRLGAAAEGSFATAREAFEQLFALLRGVDEDPTMVFFADEAGSWQIPVDWHAVLPLYFRCLADGTSGETFARTVDTAAPVHMPGTVAMDARPFLCRGLTHSSAGDLPRPATRGCSSTACSPRAYFVQSPVGPSMPALDCTLEP